MKGWEEGYYGRLSRLGPGKERVERGNCKREDIFTTFIELQKPNQNQSKNIYVTNREMS